MNKKSNTMNTSKSMVHGTARAIASVLVCAFIFSMMTGCMLLPPEEKEHRVSVVTEDISDQYDLAMADYRDVILTDTISCTYSQLSEEPLSFGVGGRTVSYLYVSEGDTVTRGQLLAKLDVDDLENEIINLNANIVQYELSITQQQEMIDFYNERIGSPETSLADREDYRLKLTTCNEQIGSYNTKIERAYRKIDADKDTIRLSQIFSPIDGSVARIKDDLVGSRSVKGSKVITVIDTAVCAFQATDREAAEYMQLGTSVTVVTSSSTGKSCPASVTAIDPENSRIVFELDEPDYTLTVGTRGTIRLTRDMRAQVLSVPRVAVFSTDEFDYVYVLSENGVREIAKVRLGLVGDDYVEIVEGLQPNDSVILRKS